MAGWLAKRLGYGIYGIVDIDNPETAPTVTATVIVPTAGTFTRILTGQFKDNEEVRLDKPAFYLNSFEYVGIALVGSSIEDDVWDVVRVEWLNNRKIGILFRSAISWADRAVGW